MRFMKGHSVARHLLNFLFKAQLYSTLVFAPIAVRFPASGLFCDSAAAGPFHFYAPGAPDLLNHLTNAALSRRRNFMHCALIRAYFSSR